MTHRLRSNMYIVSVCFIFKNSYDYDLTVISILESNRDEQFRGTHICELFYNPLSN